MKSDYEIVTMDATERQIWRYLLTSVVTVLFACSFAAGLVYTFAFTDTKTEMLDHALVSILTVTGLGLALAAAKKKEERGILPRWLRRTIWLGVIGTYIAATVLFFTSGREANQVDRAWLSLKLGSLAVLPFIAWRLVRDKNA